MSLRTRCPDCAASFTLGDDMEGKKVRCNKCQEPFVVKKLTAKQQLEDEDEERETRIQSKSKPATSRTTPARPSPARRPREEDEDEERPARNRRKRDEDEDEDELPRSRKQTADEGGKNNMPWIVGGSLAGVLILTIGVVAAIAVTRDKKDTTQANNQVQDKNPPGNNPPENKPPENKPPENKPPENKPPENKPPEKDPTKPATPGQISKEDVQKVKKATVYIRVALASGGGATGTGFFGDSEAPNLVLTNAHVIGMLSPESLPPKLIQVIINSGQTDQKILNGIVIGVDRASDLAVIDVGNRPGLPTPLTVKTSTTLTELDKVYTFGFPLGESLGKEITIRDSSVSSLRKNKFGDLDRIQVNGGMDPGNSGGPVVDSTGHVVGVAVAGIPGRMINFAIPGERVHTILRGRIETVGIDMPYVSNGKVTLPTRVYTIDPRKKIKEVGMIVWTGNSGTFRAPSATTPPVLNGDTAHVKVKLVMSGTQASGDVTLPELPAGKVWWTRPYYVGGDNKTYYASANVYRTPSIPVERKAANLFVKYPIGGNGRRVILTVTNKMLFGSGDEQSEIGAMTTRATLTEKVTAATGFSTSMSLTYRDAAQVISMDGEKPQPSSLLAKAKRYLPVLRGLVSLDAAGNVKTNTVSNKALLNRSKEGRDLLDFHETIQQGLDAAYIPMPNKTLNALSTWKAQRYLPLETPKGVRKVLLDMTCTYLGSRKRNGREEAMISLDGTIRDKNFSGKAGGTLLLDLASGTITLMQIDSRLDMEGGLRVGDKVVKVRAVDVFSMTLQRDL